MIDPKELEAAVTVMKPRQRIYEIIKAELKRRGHWKNKAGGKQMERGFDPRRHTL